MPIETIVFIPGLLCDPVLWQVQVRVIGQHFHCVVADITQHQSVQAMARNVLTVNSGQYHVVGFSLGA